MITLTDEQHRAIGDAGGSPVRVEDPETKLTYVLMNAELYEQIRSMVEPDKPRVEEFAPLIWKAMKGDWDDSSMDAYDRFPEKSLTLEESLHNIAADLLSFRRFVPFVERLFMALPGKWQAVADCCSVLPVLPKLAPAVFAENAESFYVTHLSWPGSDDGDPYALVLFVHTEELWSTIASYNRAVLGNA